MPKLYEILDPSAILYENLAFKTYGIFDGVKYPTLYDDLEDGVLEYEMLFREEALREKLCAVAPFLVELEFDVQEKRVQTLALLDTYEKDATIFLSTPLDLDSVLEKLRDLFYIYNAEGEKGYFRFYDPKIFTQLIIQQDESLLWTLFSKIYCYWCIEPDEKQHMVQYFLKPEGIEQKRLVLNKVKDSEHE